MHAKNVFPDSPVGSQSVGHLNALELRRFTIARSSALMSLGKFGKNNKTRSRQKDLGRHEAERLARFDSRWVALIDLTSQNRNLPPYGFTPVTTLQ